MSDLQIFAFFGLPILVVALGALVYLVEMRRLRPIPDDEPDLFDRPRRAMANSEGLGRPSRRSR